MDRELNTTAILYDLYIYILNIYIYIHLQDRRHFKGGTYPKCKLHFSRCFGGGN